MCRAQLSLLLFSTSGYVVPGIPPPGRVNSAKGYSIARLGQHEYLNAERLDQAPAHPWLWAPGSSAKCDAPTVATAYWGRPITVNTRCCVSFRPSTRPEKVFTTAGQSPYQQAAELNATVVATYWGRPSPSVRGIDEKDVLTAAGLSSSPAGSRIAILCKGPGIGIWVVIRNISYAEGI